MTTHTHRCQHFENVRVIRTPGGRRRVPMSEVQRYLSQRTPDQQEEA